MRRPKLEPGDESFEILPATHMTKYKRRHSSGKMFSCIAASLPIAYGKFHEWCKSNNLHLDPILENKGLPCTITLTKKEKDMAKATTATKKAAGKGAAAAAAAKAKAAAKKAPKKKEEPVKVVEPEVVEVPQAEEQLEVTMERKFLAAQPEPFPNVAEFTEEQVAAELKENIGLLEEGDKVTVEALEDGPAIWGFLCGMRKDLAGKKVEEQTTGKGKGKGGGKKAEGGKKVTVVKMTYNRAEAVVDALKELGKGTDKEIAARADELFATEGGKSNPSETLFNARIVLKALCRAGITTLGEDKVISLN